MKHLLKLSLILLAFLLPATAVANPITLQQAQQNALSFLESKGKSISSSSLRQAQLRSTSTANETYYAFNIGNNEGYVITAGDDCAPAILGYADAGYIDVDSMPVNLKSWLEEYAQQIQFMQKNGFASFKAPKLASSYAVIPPLMTTTWDQQDPYNQYCPDFFSYGKCVTGCVATAMAQVMYYHRANSVAQTTAQIPAYDCRTLWLNGSDTLGHIHVDAIPAGSPIDWSNMLDSYSGSTTATQKQAVANLMKYCGASVRMNYANAWSGGSGAYSSDVPIALKSYFNYSDETTLKYRSNYSSDAAWEDLVYNELSSSRPVYYSGSNSSGGHAFVCDGYDGSGYYHINWGWSGTSDGYFLLTALDPNQQGTGGSSSGYNQNQAALINAQPKSSSPSNPVLVTSISLNKTSATVTEGNTLQLTATVLPTNATNRTVTWKSSNTSVATVSSSGLVTAKSSGSATITVTTTDGTNLSANCSVTVESGSPESTIISFVDPRVKALCVQNWDTNGDVELSRAEAAAVTNLGTVFKNNSTITSFDELQYFTGLTSIEEYAFSCCWYLTSITIPSSVTSIGYDAFSSCSRLTGITIPSSVVSISNYAFDYCSGLTNITIPSSVTSIGAYAFRGCSSLASIKVDSNNPKYDSRSNCNAIIHTSSNQLIVGCKNTVFLNSVTSIGEGAFYGCTGLTNLTIPSSITYIGSAAFRGCSSLANVKVESGNSKYDSRNNCNAIIYTSSNRLVVGCKNTIIPNSVTSIGGDAFYGCNGLTNLTIPNSVTSIGSYVFDDCSGLTSITIPKSVTSIGIRVFEGCSGLTSMIVENGNSKYDSRNNCNAIIETNSNKLINGCKNTTIPNTVTSIGEDAFSGCNSLTSISIPASVVSIGDYAFHNCTGLSKITCFATTPPVIYSHTFPSSVTNRAYLYVLAESLNAYQSASYWKNFIYIQEIPVLATSISLNQTSATLYMGNTLQLIATVLPSATTDKTVSWSSNNTSVATVSSNGLVTPKSTGSATITVRTEDGSNLTAQCIVTVKQYATSISLSETNVTICTGNTLQLAATVMPSTTSNPSVTWTSSNTSVATVSSTGLVTAKSTGNATITARTADGSNLSASCSVTVKQLATSISLSQTEATMYTGNTLQLTATVLPSTTSNPAVTWTSSNTSVATVSSEGLVTAVSPGNAIITATTTDGSNLSATCSLFVKQNIIYVTSISLDKTSATITEGEDLQLMATVLPEDATNKTVTWNSSNSSVATVSTDGLVTAKSPGSAIITAMTADGTNLSATCVVTVVDNQIDYDNYLSMSDTVAFHGETIVIPVSMTNAKQILSFQTDIFLPDGLELLQEDGEYIIDPSERMTRTHSIVSNNVANGAVRVMCYSSNYKPFTGNSGDDLFYITVKVADNAEGIYTIQLKNTLLTTNDFVELAAPDVAANVNVKAYLLGDANNSGTVTVTDVVVTSQYVLELNPQPFVYEAADVNTDGNITVTDVSRIAWMVLNPAMNAPLRAPALWNNGDSMTGEDITLAMGETRRVSILLYNEMDYSAFQLDLNLPEGLTASNFQLTDRAGNHAFDVNTLQNGNIRALCYSPSMTGINGHEGALLTFDVTATGVVTGDILVDGIELVTTDCQTVRLDDFSIAVNNATSVNEQATGKIITKVEYFNIAGQRLERLENGVNFIVTTYTDGTCTTQKIVK